MTTNMTKDQLLREIYRQNPSFQTQGANLSAQGFLKLFNLVWDRGYAYGKELERKAQSPNPFTDMLKNAHKATQKTRY